MYLSLIDLKARLWITWDDQNTSLQWLLDRSRSMIQAQWYDFTQGNHRKTCWIYDRYTSVALDYPNVTAIVKINWESVTLTKGTDYLIKWQYDHIVTLQWWSNWLINLWGSTEIEYTAWFANDSIPTILQDAQFYMICWIRYDDTQATNMFNGTKEVKDVTQWPRKVSYVVTSSKKYYDQATDIFNAIFYPIDLP